MNKIDLIIDALSVAQNSVWSKLKEEALAYAVELKLELAKPEQEPVRWFQQFGDAPLRKEWVSLSDRDITGAAHNNAKYPVSILETTDSGLCMQFSETGEWHASDKGNDFMKVNSFLMSFAKALEAKLKELNT